MRSTLKTFFLLTTLACASACTEGENNANNSNNTNNTNNTTLDMNVKKDMKTNGDMGKDLSTVTDLGTDMKVEKDLGDMCENVTIYADGDGDGYGQDADTKMVCLKQNESPEAGYARKAGDCSDSDPLQHTMAEGVCGDNVDDDCDGNDEACPTSQPAQMNVPTWDCTGTPPDNVYAWAVFADGKDYFKDNGCFVFFQGAKNAFFVQRTNLERKKADEDCHQTYGCVCPSLNGWASYDRRLYALTKSDTQQECEELALKDHAGQSQPVSNACRKYLYQLHRYDIPYSFVSTSAENLKKRLTAFPSVEIACLEDSPHANLPFKSLLSVPVKYNDGFKPMN